MSYALSSKWAVTCDFKQCGILTSVDSDEPVQPPFKLRNSKWCSVSSLALIEYSSDKQKALIRLRVCAADLRLCWSHIPHCWKSHAAAHIICNIHIEETLSGKWMYWHDRVNSDWFDLIYFRSADICIKISLHCAELFKLDCLKYERRHKIPNSVVCATTKTSDQPAHTRGLIRAFASHLNIIWLLSYWLYSISSF